MDNAIHPKIQELVSKHNQIGVVVTKNPTIDHMAAGLGLYLAIRQMGKTVVIVSPTPPTVEISSLVGIDKVKQTLGTDGGDITVSFPYREGEIEKVSYTLDNGYLNIVVKAGDKGLTFHEKEIQFKRGGKAPKLLFFVGVQRLSDLGSLFNAEAMKDTVIINIDNKPDNQGYGDVVVVSPRFSSLSEQIAQLLSMLDWQIDIDVDIAQNLLSGITHATDDFQDPKTSPVAFEMAGRLMQKGATRKKQSVREERHDGSSFFPQQPRPQQQFPQRMQQPFTQRPQPFQRSQQQQQFTQTPQQAQHQQDNQPPERPQRQAPPDWLTPKVYKGSTIL